MYTYMYTLLELFVIRCHSLTVLYSQENDVSAVEHLKNPAIMHKKSPIDIICQQDKNVGGIGLEPTTSCVSSRRSSQLS